ncbi:MAG: hypothetical protein FJ135_07265 [Deltaproteobacteria bacterium]|nr:hypothetical protein [Deltaproteobacteria bacterium]
MIKIDVIRPNHRSLKQQERTGLRPTRNSWSHHTDAVNFSGWQKPEAGRRADKHDRTLQTSGKLPVAGEPGKKIPTRTCTSLNRDCDIWRGASGHAP